MATKPAQLSGPERFLCDNRDAPEGAGHTNSGARPAHHLREVLAVANILPPQIHESLNDPTWGPDLWSYVDGRPDGCWLWTGARTSGYGFYSRSNWNTTRAHRLTFMWVNGPIKHGRVIDHLCRVTACVNPAHLEAITDRENILRGVGSPAQNAVADTCKNGHPLSGENLIPYYLERGERQCRLCMRERSRVRHFKRESESPDADTCPACARSIHVCKSGVMHKHRTPDRQVCPGSGMAPIEAVA